MIKNSTRIRIRISNDVLARIEEYQTDNDLTLSLAVEQLIIKALGGSKHGSNSMLDL